MKKLFDLMLAPATLSNLVDFIVTCITRPHAANRTFVVSDGQDLSTSELVRGMAQAMNRPTGPGYSKRRCRVTLR